SSRCGHRQAAGHHRLPLGDPCASAPHARGDECAAAADGADAARRPVQPRAPDVDAGVAGGARSHVPARAMSRRLPPVAVLPGRTGTGKTDIALKLAREFPLEIVSVDSAQVYRGLDIGSAKPEAAIRAQVPHHLIDLADPAESYSAGQFVRDA